MLAKRPITRLVFTSFMLISLFFSGLGVTPVYAAGITVNTNVDELTTNGKCSLREAIINANNNNATRPDCATAFGTDTITFAGNYTITLAGDQLPAVTSPIIINGKGAGKTIIQANASPDTATYRVFEVSYPGNLTLDSLTVRHGRCNGTCTTTGNHGGGIYNIEGTLTVTNSTLSGNSADIGGGIYNTAGVLTMANSTLSGNSADIGGGILNSSGGTLTITNSTLSGNSANDGGGISNSGTQTVTNSTFSGNNAAAWGGGIFNFGTLTVTNSTLSGNSADSGGGINNNGTLHYANTIIANSSNGGDCLNNGSIGTNTNNLVEDSSCSAPLSGDPKLGPLANNGSPTQTLALLSGSPAIDTGNDSTCASAPVNNLDQRGVTRPQGSHCDIGAYEKGITQTFNSQGTNDGWILESTETSGVGGTKNNTASTLILGDDAANRQYHAILSFNTSRLPDNASIAKVILKLRRQGVSGGDNPITIFSGFMVDIKKGNFGTASLALGDFSAKASKTLGAFKPKLVSGWYSMNLTTGKAQINTEGNTQIRLRFKLDDNNNNAANILKLYSGNAGDGNRPYLYIEYYVP